MEEWGAVRSSTLSMKGSYKLFQVKKIGAKGRRRQESFILAEKSDALFLNDQEVITFLATPANLKELAVGFMPSEGWHKENKPVKRVDVDRG